MQKNVASDVEVVPGLISNAYLVGHGKSWVLIDTGAPSSVEAIEEAVRNRFGSGAKPRAILLTHGHFDHAGSAPALAKKWNVRVYATRLEFPYLTGESAYPPLDTTAPGIFSKLAAFFPSKTADVSAHLQELSRKLDDYGMAGWELIDTPGHTPGHVSFFRRGDGVLIAGDAVTTMDLDTFSGILSKAQRVCRPPVPATTDWQAAKRSVRALAALKPRLIAPGHGEPMADAAAGLQKLADDFRIPEHGRYVGTPAQADETGITFLPPAPPNRFLYRAIGAGAAAAAIAIGIFLLIQKNKSGNGGG